MLTRDQAIGLESHDIWGYFQHKFARIGGLAKYRPFFERLLRANIEACIEQNIFLLELRHTSGCLLRVSADANADGPGAKNENGKVAPMDVKIGDIVLFGKWSGTEVKIDGKEYSIMKESDIMGVSKSKK